MPEVIVYHKEGQSLSYLFLPGAWIALCEYFFPLESGFVSFKLTALELSHKFSHTSNLVNSGKKMTFVKLVLNSLYPLPSEFYSFF